MNKLKQCIYTVILLITCFVASPFIYKQIWKNSELKKAKVKAKEPVITAQQNSDPDTATQDSTSETQPTSEGESLPADSTEAATAPPAPQTSYVRSGPEYFDNALFIGDSRTVGLSKYGTLKNADYFCDIGLSAYKIDTSNVDGKTVWGKLNDKKYGKIYVMLGINEIGNDIEGTVASYRKLVDGIRQVQPDAVIYLEGNLHVASFAQTELITNERIDILNSKLSEMADSSKNIYYLNVNGIFDDESGALTADYTEDGIHVFAKYYTIWCDWLCENTVPQGGGQEATVAENTAAEAPSETALPQNEEFSNR